MRVFLLLVVCGLACGASVQNVAPAAPVTDYHGQVGFALAAQIKADEEAIIAGTNNEDAKTWQQRIVGGTAAPTNAYPYLAGLVIYVVGSAGVSACGSSLLTANRLVTAAHCWTSSSHQAYQFEVVLGSPFLFFGGTRVTTSNVVMHPQYIPSLLLNDVAMIYLSTNIAFTQSIQPISLPFSTQLWMDFTGWWAIAAGYGKTSDQQTGVQLDTSVQHVNLPVISNLECQQTFQNWVTAGNVCTRGTGGVGICGGDSGGPLVVNNGGQPILIGISSFVASTGCQSGFPSAFARVTTYYSFIVSHL